MRIRRFSHTFPVLADFESKPQEHIYPSILLTPLHEYSIKHVLALALVVSTSAFLFFFALFSCLRQLLISNGADANHTNILDQTAMEIATAAGHTPIELFLE